MSVALIIQHAKRMRLIILSSVTSPAVPYFPRYLKDATIFEKKKKLFNMRYVLWISLQFLSHASLA
jgi:hypothetical protein